jgi:hypothetical protein
MAQVTRQVGTEWSGRGRRQRIPAGANVNGTRSPYGPRSNLRERIYAAFRRAGWATDDIQSWRSFASDASRQDHWR